MMRVISRSGQSGVREFFVSAADELAEVPFFVNFAATPGLRRRPEIYLVNGNGALNAFAAQATGHD